MQPNSHDQISSSNLPLNGYDSITAAGGAENRPANIYLMYCIKQ
jgi:hypothetical protein